MQHQHPSEGISKWIPLELSEQPTETSCGPTCLHAIYSYYNVHMPLENIISNIETVQGGGTLGVILGNHALSLGFATVMYTCNLLVFDPTWFPSTPDQLAAKLRASLPYRRKPKMLQAIKAYIRFCELGGEIRMEVLNSSLIRKFLNHNRPILSGLSSTFLYGDMRANPHTDEDDDLAGEAEGHFVLLTGYNKEDRSVQIEDPYPKNPIDINRRYSVPMDRLINAILLGVLTYDANLLIIQPRT